MSSISIAHLDTERRYWYSLLKPLCEKVGLWWDVATDLALGTVTIKIVHPNDVAAAKSVYKNMDPSLISLINADRKKRPEAEILKEVEEHIALRTKDR